MKLVTTRGLGARWRSGTLGMPAGLFLLLVVLLPLLLPNTVLPEKFKPLYHALVQGFALVAALSVPLPDPAKTWCIIGLGLCATGSVLSMPEMAKFIKTMMNLPPLLHVAGLGFIGLAFVNWAQRAATEAAKETSHPVPVPAPTPVVTQPYPAAPLPAKDLDAGKTMEYRIPEQTEAEVKLADLARDLEFLEELERGLMICVPAQVLILSSTLRVKLCNNQFREFFRLVTDEEVGKDLNSLIPNKELLKGVQEAIGRKDVKELEFRHYVKKVGEKRLMARIFGGIDGLVILCLQELMEATDSNVSRLPKTQIINVQSEKLQLAGGLFEDLETSVVPILDQAGATLEALTNSTDVRANVREALESLQGQFNGMRRLIKSYQKFAEQHLEVAEEIRIDQTVEGALDPKNFAFDLTGISIVKDFGLKRPKIEANEKQLRQAFINLFANAFEAIRRNGVQGEVGVRLQEEFGRVKVHITDNGGGMPADKIKDAFKGSYSTKSGGAGLGLVTAQRIVQGAKGTITATTVEGRSSTFTVEMPVV
jgi:signal transduction histidine kinase